MHPEFGFQGEGFGGSGFRSRKVENTDCVEGAQKHEEV